MSSEIEDLEAEAVAFCIDLIKINSTNFGDGAPGVEEEAAAYVVAKLEEAGLQPTVIEAKPGRPNVVARIMGSDPAAPGLVVHGHLDVVPVDGEGWLDDPFSGVVRDGMIWGRGAVDMKYMVAMMVAAARFFVRTSTTPARDIVFAFFADEEAGGLLGARHVVECRPDLFQGCTEAVGEGGGFNFGVEGPSGVELPYTIQAAEKGILWLELEARGQGGHASLPREDAAVHRLVRALARVESYTWDRLQIPAVRGLVTGLASLRGLDAETDDLEEVIKGAGGLSRVLDATTRNTVSITKLTAGVKENVVPDQASAILDCRYLPGCREQVLETVRELAAPDATVREVFSDIALEAPLDAPIVARMARALRSQDREASVLPFCFSGGSDNKHLSRLGITGYGFSPLAGDEKFDFMGMFHGVNERVPVSGVEFGARVLWEFLRNE